ncbi:DNA-binding Lrp family transcriptional regulator [Prauserella sediminis]|uniref:DNA-binding Lrp family transcriptional regulator n=1 Tax=Prauserella sediminis TaxID=577680 RepID=A0A839XRB1_9PSEU|nr:AsnC family transcriptional regulator [Prauserella sediminis]MBB3664529.1 DNA-binding Lrp family transcriptional regulator [Prauserella sediminis]
MSERTGSAKANFDTLDRRIACALQIDGRAPWTTIAHALGESERTVLRRGTQLLDARMVVVAGRPAAATITLVGVQCEPGRARTTAHALAQRPDTVIVHLVTGDPDCVAVVNGRPGELARLVLDDLPGIRGISRTTSQPVLRHVHSIAEWRPGELTDAEVAALRRERPWDGATPHRGTQLPDRADELILRTLADDGRTTVEELARLTGLSDTTVRRRIEALTRTGALTIRAVVDPALFGYPVEAVLRLTVPPNYIDDVADEIAHSPHTRYVAITMGNEQIFVLAAFPDTQALQDFITTSPWVERVRNLTMSQILATAKRGGVVTPT